MDIFAVASFLWVTISHLDDGDYTGTNADVLNRPLHHTLPRFEHNLDIDS